MDETAAARDELVRQLVAARHIRSPEVEAAFKDTPRHLFVPDADPELAYADAAIFVKFDSSGQPISSASQPTIVATMLQHLQVGRGQRVLEVGTGTGYNAALLEHLVGDEGSVVSVEIEPDLAATAARALASSGYDRVDVVTGDGSQGHPRGAPYHRIIVTTGAHGVADAWTDQLADGGRLVVPVVDENGVGAMLVFEKVDGEIVKIDETFCGFLPIRTVPST